ncbi:uncharacterized protein LOC130711991 [Lotus japonicus]|uniref:uncharacterized protein LOC130711991 n=1 Tax=Lotus japonicus TaxID=34305 RepID=UPI002582D1C2|nr:uncharacterized protein LOC130711991 [Lotus japonicus]
MHPTDMSSKITAIKDVCQRKKFPIIRTRVLRMWGVYPVGHKIEAIAPKGTMSKFKSELHEGKVYRISSFAVVANNGNFMASEHECNFSLSERLVAKYGGAAAMYFVSKKLKKKHNITDERVALYGAAEQWIDALKGRKFLGGHFVTVDSSKEMIGTFSPQTDPYTHEMPDETTPSGIFARRAYSARSKFVDDDNKCYLEIDYTFDIRKDWQ